MSTKDVFLNIAGGLKIEDPAVDLAVLGAILSSIYDAAIPLDWALSGEVGLAGEIRSVARADQRALEAHRLRFHRFLSASFPREAASALPAGLCHGVNKVEELTKLLLRS